MTSVQKLITGVSFQTQWQNVRLIFLSVCSLLTQPTENAICALDLLGPHSDRAATVMETGIDCVSTCDRLAPKSFWKLTIARGSDLSSAIWDPQFGRLWE